MFSSSNILAGIRTLSLSILLCLPLTAHAGDFAKREILGFSKDGTRFAFMQYGVQDGSGFPYADVFVIDTTTDQWVKGSPFSVLIESEEIPVPEATARSRALEAASGALATITQPGLHVASNQPPYEVSADPYSLTARPFEFNPPTDKQMNLEIQLKDVSGADYCEGLTDTKGLRLIMSQSNYISETRVLQDDKSIPRSRACATDYRFADLVTYHPEFDQDGYFAAIIQVQSYGFEGPDGRYIAITGRIPPIRQN